MLSAQKQQMPNERSTDSSPPTSTGFGKVLHSIQGLQQRLNDFSVDDVNRAHAQAHTLIRELDGLHIRLNALANLKQTALAVDAQLAAIPEHNFDSIGPDSLEGHPQLHAILQAGELLRTRLKSQEAQENAEATSFDVPLSGNDVASSQFETSIAPRGIVQAVSPHALTAADVTQSSAKSDQIQQVMFQESVAHASPARPTYDFADLKLEESPRRSAVRQVRSAQSEAGSKGPSTKSKKLKGKPQIDHRLLNDLIETYGEFANSTGSAVAAELAEPSHSVIETPPEPTEPPQRVVKTEAEPSEAITTASVSADRAFVDPVEATGLLGLPAPKQEREEPIFDGPGPSSRSQNEIDRQLKSIIKDYGEYDLYSHQKSFNIKTAVIAAVAGLSLLVGGFFYFRAPSASKPAVMESTISEANSVDSEKPTSAKPGSE